MMSSWNEIKESLLLHPEYRSYEDVARDVRKQRAAHLGLSLEEYDEKLHWGFSEFYD